MVDLVLVSNMPPVLGQIIIAKSCFGTVLAIAMAVIAIANIVLTTYIFKIGRKDSQKNGINNRRFELMLALLLNSNINKLYDFYNKLSEECEKLSICSDNETKTSVNNFILAEQMKFRLDFITLIKVVDSDLYSKLVDLSDSLVDGITESIFNEGINLCHRPMFDEKISQPISRNRIAFLSTLYKIADISQATSEGR